MAPVTKPESERLESRRTGESKAIMLTLCLPGKRLLLLGGSCAVFAAAAVIFWSPPRRRGGAGRRDNLYQEHRAARNSDDQGRRPRYPQTARRGRRPKPDLAAYGQSVRPTTSRRSAAMREGNVSETRVERGSFVKKGDVLVQIDPRDAQNALTRASTPPKSCASGWGWTKPRNSALTKCPRSRRPRSPWIWPNTLSTARRVSKSKMQSPWKATTRRLRISCGRATVLPGPAAGKAIESQLSVGRDAPGHVFLP